MLFKFWSKIRYSSVVVDIRNKLPHGLVNNLKHLPVGILANLIYGFPSKQLTIVGITGTDGKTTTAAYLYHLMHKSGLKTALISTVSARIGNKTLDTGFHVTSPDHFALQRLLRRMVNQGIDYLVLEVTSHGLVQHRLWGVKFTGGIITNVAEDHLDYHTSWKNYLKAKAKLFKKTKFAVLNIEDKSYRFLQPISKGKVISYGLKKGNLNEQNLGFDLPVKSDFNKLNLLAAVVAAQALGVKTKQIRTSLKTLPEVKGRMELIQAKSFRVVVDFAHTPNALKEALTSLRGQVAGKGQLIAVFGCAGERDRGRRKMGKVAAELADKSIITAEDPRTEGVAKISVDISRWAEKGGAIEVDPDQLKEKKDRVFAKINDREEAITKALAIAQEGDVIGIFGKGHEKSMCFGDKEYPWSDQKVVKRLLGERK